MSVDTSTLTVQVRENSGKGVARKLRAKGLIPAVVYGKHLEKPAHIAVDPKAVRAAVNTPHKLNTLITLNAGEQSFLVLLKDFQVEPVSRAMLHADFIAVRETEPVKVSVPLILTGRAEGVVAGGLLTQIRREIEVYALPRSIPEKIEVDVTPLKVNQALHINDVKLPEGVTVKTNVNYALATISAPEETEAKPTAEAKAAGKAAAKPAAKPAAGKK